ncbi:LacI family transcriptional regulator [Paenibacillus cellulosilyticus]|uniref:LacI family transcriptional regulator n=1 Tax=Paenibacillus cellulosilyticus TaxID=375489 RepID=A0A2V2Z2Y0_9BACL|nr:LacI family DNA-binding transcriptional regulator [Paenibacillus cellulosilyticus]PWW07455.1 LacI family transcriptional regulator [Paenibacillus cellulosilyticus]QKS44387.1 LacI family DNA-binding transcriptional regulator [Paenibacillus cellulosilyticus]
MREKVTIQQIADFAGVSKFAVSRALAGKSGVSESTKDRILKAAGQLGYFRSRVSNVSEELHDPESAPIAGTIVVLFPNIRFQNKESFYWGPVFDGISARLNQKSMDILTLTEPSSDRVFTLLNPDAILGIVTVGTISTQILLEIKRLDIPVVMVDHYDPAIHCDTIFTDNFMCMRELTTKLVSRGYRRFKFVGDVEYAHSFYERWVAFRSVLDQHQIEYDPVKGLIAQEDSTVSDYVEQMDESELPDVFVCANDFIADNVKAGLIAKGIQVPERCGVTGFDNTSPAMTTVNVDKDLLGMRAVDKLLWRCVNRNSNAERLLIEGDVLMRETTIG